MHAQRFLPFMYIFIDGQSQAGRKKERGAIIIIIDYDECVRALLMHLLCVCQGVVGAVFCSFRTMRNYACRKKCDCLFGLVRGDEAKAQTAMNNLRLMQQKIRLIYKSTQIYIYFFCII